MDVDTKGASFWEPLKTIHMLPHFWPSQTIYSHTLLQIHFGETAMFQKNAALTAPGNPKDCFQIYQKSLNLNNTSDKCTKIKEHSFLSNHLQIYAIQANHGNDRKLTSRCSSLNDRLEPQCLAFKFSDQLCVLGQVP